MERLDQQTFELQKYCESKCMQIYKKKMDFSGPVQTWNFRRRCYGDLARRHTKGVKNMSNIVQRCARAGILYPKQLTKKQCEDGVVYYRHRLMQLKKEAKWLRRQMMQERKRHAGAAGDKEAVEGISQTMQQEWNRSMWPRIN